MSFPAADPHRDEPTVELDHDLWNRYRRAQNNADGWQYEADRLKDQIVAQLGDAYAATVDGEKVVSYRPQSRYAVARIKQDYPDLVPHFTVTKKQEVFDVDQFIQQHPEIADKYRVRSFRRLGAEE